MPIILAQGNTDEQVAMRDAYVDTLLELATQNERILALDADLMLAMGSSGLQLIFRSGRSTAVSKKRICSGWPLACQ